MSNQKVMIKKKILGDFFASILFLLGSLSCLWPDFFQFREIKISNILLGCLLLLITYYFVFPDFKKNSGFAKCLFFIESILFLFISCGLFLFLFITNEFLKKILNLSNIICYICCIHSLIEMYVFAITNTKKSILKFN
ncbi:hypothetical protein, partial [Candidatus Phytoplasma melaleucae]